MSNSMIKYEPSGTFQTYTEMVEGARMLVKSGFLPKHISTPESALAVMVYGKELGIGPMTAMHGIFPIDGKLSIAPQLALAVAMNKGLLKNIKIEDGDGFCVATGTRANGITHSVKYTLEDAKKAGLTGKSNWSKYQANMLRWRAVGYMLDVVCPDALGGLNFPDEMGAVTDSAGIPTGETVQIDGKPIEVTEAEVVKVTSDEEALMDMTKKNIASAEKKTKDNFKDKKLISLWKEVKRYGFSEDDWRIVLKSLWGVESTKELTMEQIADWDRLIADLALGEKKKEDIMNLAKSRMEE